MATAKRRLVEDPERVDPVTPVHIWRTPPGAAVTMVIVAHFDAYRVMHDQAIHALPNETGGFLVGRVGHDQVDGVWHVEIEEAIPVEPLSQDPVHFSFSWRDVDHVRSHREAHGKALLGWYHTHPDLGIFLSDTDLERTHRVLFGEPFQIALVYDPVRTRAGYFFWEGPQQIDASQAGWREFTISVPKSLTPAELGVEQTMIIPVADSGVGTAMETGASAASGDDATPAPPAESSAAAGPRRLSAVGPAAAAAAAPTVTTLAGPSAVPAAALTEAAGVAAGDRPTAAVAQMGASPQSRVMLLVLAAIAGAALAWLSWSLLRG